MTNVRYDPAKEVYVCFSCGALKHPEKAPGHGGLVQTKESVVACKQFIAEHDRKEHTAPRPRNWDVILKDYRAVEVTA